MSKTINSQAPTQPALTQPAFFKLLHSRWTLLILLLAGILLLIMAKQNAGTAEQQAQTIFAQQVQLQPITIGQHTPQIRGHGTVQPVHEINQVAEVAARILWRHPDLNAGAHISAGTQVLRLDSSDYQLALQQAKAQQQSLLSEQQQLRQNQQTLTRQNQLLNQRIDLAQAQLTRKQTLASDQALSTAELQAEQQNLLVMQQEQADLQRQLKLIPSQQQSLQAQIASAQAAIEREQRNVNRTDIRMPFSGRISDVSAQVDGFAAQGQSLFSAIGIDQAEVEAQFSLEQLRRFIRYSTNADTLAETADTNSGQSLSQPSAQSLIKKARLHARVRLALTPDQFWHGEVIEVRERLNERSHTLGVLVRIDQPYANIIPGQRPPLLAGLPVTVELRARAQPLIALPIAALHHNDSDSGFSHNLYLARASESLPKKERSTKQPSENQHATAWQLKKWPVNEVLISGDQALLLPQALSGVLSEDLSESTSELNSGPEANTATSIKLVVNDLTPAIDGMALIPTANEIQAEEK